MTRHQHVSYECFFLNWILNLEKETAGNLLLVNYTGARTRLLKVEALFIPPPPFVLVSSKSLKVFRSLYNGNCQCGFYSYYWEGKKAYLAEIGGVVDIELIFPHNTVKTGSYLQAVFNQKKDASNNEHHLQPIDPIMKWRLEQFSESF